MRSPKEIHESLLRFHRNKLIELGISNPAIGPGTDDYVRYASVANEIAVLEANGVIAADQVFWDTATGDALIERGRMFGLEPRNAAGSLGPIVFESSAPSGVITGQELIDSAGLRYKVSVGGTYANGDVIPIEAVDSGEATNLPEGTTLRWVTAPPFSAPSALVGIGGLINGVDAENEETYRQRIFARVQTPPGSGNDQQVAELAEESSPSVQKAFVYPAAQGPATAHVAVTAAPTATNASREVATPLMNGTIIPYLDGNLPTRILLKTTTVEDVDADVSIALSLPAASTASPPGPGGGWLDGSPWPRVNGTSTFKVTVTSVVSSSEFTVDASTPPVENVSRIAWFSRSELKLYKATVTHVTGLPGAFSIIIDTPFVGITTGSYIFPQSVNQLRYIAAVLAAFELMGPGEKTANISALIRAFRHPTPNTSWPYSLGPHIPRALTDSGTEVLNAQFLYRAAGASTLSGPSGVIVPAVPSNIEDPPKIFVPRNIGLYPQP